MILDRYLKRIGYHGRIATDRTTLDDMMTAHINSVTFENLNQQLGVPVTMDLAETYEKVVSTHRGGWCFELNSLFAWALNEIGFSVQMLAGQVGHSQSDPTFLANHMLLWVDLEEPLLVDVGFGCGLASAIPLAPNSSQQLPYDVSVTALDDEFLRYAEQARDEPATYDFTLQPVDRAYFGAACHRLQTDADSPFLRTLTAQQRRGDEHLILRGLVLRTVARDRTKEVILSSSDELVQCLRDTFGLDVPEVAGIWPRIQKRHNELFNSQ